MRPLIRIFILGPVVVLALLGTLVTVFAAGVTAALNVLVAVINEAIS
jgi:hypothetical protein